MNKDIMRKFKLYEDNPEYANEAMKNFLDLYRSMPQGMYFSDYIFTLDPKVKTQMRDMYSFYKDGLFDEYGALKLNAVDLSKPLTKEDLYNALNATSAFDKRAIINGWIIDTKGNVYPAKNHARFLNFLTLFGVDCTSFVRVAPANIGITKVNFSNASNYLNTDTKPQITEAQVQAMYNLKVIYEKRFNDIPLPFKDYILDSMLGGFLDYGDGIDTENLKQIEKFSPEQISSKETYSDYLYYKKYKSRYEDDYGRELRI